MPDGTIKVHSFIVGIVYHEILIYSLFFQKACADLVSVLAMTSDEKNDCIKYRMLGAQEPIGDWGHE